MEFKDIVHKRYATKTFDGKQLPLDKVQQLLEMIRYAPSSFNIQPWKIKVITDQATKEKLLPVSWNQPQITSCSHLLIFCADTNIIDNIHKLEKALGPQAQGYIDMMKGFANNLTPEQKLSWAQRQVYLALANALNGATSLGFDSCPMEGFSAADYSKILNLPAHLVPTVVCPIGFAADVARPKMRFSKEEVFF
ncbi:NAD(P)H-dependent oxidoreductase [Candidatus Woesearchaeota archaeon]|nr:NAD(P)H-dependent oxidoreductase [Candidatus Woesearchaeota archaeon]